MCRMSSKETAVNKHLLEMREKSMKRDKINGNNRLSELKQSKLTMDDGQRTFSTKP